MRFGEGGSREKLGHGFSPRYLQRDCQKTALFIPYLTPGPGEALSYRIVPGTTWQGAGLRRGWLWFPKRQSWRRSQDCHTKSEAGSRCSVLPTSSMCSTQCQLPYKHSNSSNRGFVACRNFIIFAVITSTWDLFETWYFCTPSWDVNEPKREDSPGSTPNGVLCQKEHIPYQLLQFTTLQHSSLFLPQIRTHTEGMSKLLRKKTFSLKISHSLRKFQQIATFWHLFCWKIFDQFCEYNITCAAQK